MSGPQPETPPGAPFVDRQTGWTIYPTREDYEPPKGRLRYYDGSSGKDWPLDENGDPLPPRYGCLVESVDWLVRLFHKAKKKKRILPDAQLAGLEEASKFIQAFYNKADITILGTHFNAANVSPDTYCWLQTMQYEDIKQWVLDNADEDSLMRAGLI